ncbi:MAG: metalloregulator ArsR/SmtB family transcription factor [Alphaproteobacteria bacterium]|nr:metalloregulator ArsR/SmtB family transcription factor [Alphaproteobacteria bacterium]
MTDRDLLHEAADIFKLMGDPTRLAILELVLEDRLPVSEIAHRLDHSVSLISHHLRLLRAARLVRSEREGKQVFYRADDHHIEQIVADMIAHAAEARGTSPADLITAAKEKAS